MPTFYPCSLQKLYYTIIHVINIEHESNLNTKKYRLINIRLYREKYSKILDSLNKSF